MLKKFNEADFAALRIPFEPYRQSPQSFGKIFIVSIFLNVLLFVLIYLVLGDELVIPFQNIIFKIHLTVTIILSILSVVYSIPSIYLRSQKIQYLLSIIITHMMFTFNFFIIMLFLLGNSKGFSLKEAGLINVMLILVITGILLFAVTSIRFYNLLKSGAYHSGFKKNILRLKFEKKQLIVPAIIAGTGISLIIPNLELSFASFDANISLYFG